MKAAMKIMKEVLGASKGVWLHALIGYDGDKLYLISCQSEKSTKVDGLTIGFNAV